MTSQGTETAGLAAEGPEQREGWRDPSVLFRDGKSRERSGRRKTQEDRHCEASGGAAGFRASRVLRGCVAPRAWGGPRLSIAHQKTARTSALPTNPDVSARSRPGEDKGFQKAPLRRPEAARAGNLQKSGDFRGRLTRPVNALYALEAEGQRGTKKKVLRRLAPSSLKLRPAGKAGRFCRSRYNDGRQRLALTRLRAAKISGLTRQSHAMLTSTRIKNAARNARPCGHWSVPADRNSAAPITASVAASETSPWIRSRYEIIRIAIPFQSHCSPGPPISTSRKLNRRFHQVRAKWRQWQCQIPASARATTPLIKPQPTCRPRLAMALQTAARKSRFQGMSPLLWAARRRRLSSGRYHISDPIDPAL